MTWPTHDRTRVTPAPVDMTTTTRPEPSYSDQVAQQWQLSAESICREATSVRRQVEAFTSQLSATRMSGEETLTALQVDLAVFKQRLEGIERRLIRLERAEQALRGAPPPTPVN